jgi:MFS family permease
MHHRSRLLWAGFVAILAGGLGFAIRGGIFTDWSREFGFSATELGQIGGAGFTGFCFGIIIGGFLADKFGYGKLVFAAFALHLLSAFVTFGATEGISREAAYNYLLWGMFIFAYANGTLEAVANPLVATLYPENRTHYLNILHASWPAGLVIGGLAGALLGGSGGWSWQAQLSLYLIPTVAYGLMFYGQRFPQSEAATQGLSIGEMCKDIGLLGGAVMCGLIALFIRDHLHAPTILAYGVGVGALIWIGVLTKWSPGSPLLFVLFVAHALVGALELGTDGWIQNITGNLLTPTLGKVLFVAASLVMFTLRFSADFIERRIGLSPLGILLVSCMIATVGLTLISGATGTTMMMAAVLLYAAGKSFLWPTMLAVVSDRFPRTGALAISIIGGIGMMSAGLIGSPGLGYFKDRFTAEALQSTAPSAYQEARSPEMKRFLSFEPVTPVDGKLLADAIATPPSSRSSLQSAVVEASILGDRKTLAVDAILPATLTIVFTILIVATRGEKRSARHEPLISKAA